MVETPGFIPSAPAVPPIVGGVAPHDVVDGNPARIQIQTVVQQLAGAAGATLGPGVLDAVADKIYAGLSPSERVSAAAGSLSGMIAAQAQQALGVGQPLNLSAATPAEIATARAASGFSLWGPRNGHGGPRGLYAQDGETGANGAHADSGGRTAIAAAVASTSRTLDYQMLGYESPLSLARINQGNFAATPFASQAGLNYNTFNMLRGNQFSGSQILAGAKDAHEIFGPKFNLNSGAGPAVIRDTAGLRKEAPKQAAAIVRTMKTKNEMMEHDPNLRGTVDHAMAHLGGTQVNDNDVDEAAHKICNEVGRIDLQSGAKAAINDPSLNPKARGYARDLSYQVEHEQMKAIISASGKVHGVPQARQDEVLRRAEKFRRDYEGGPAPLPVNAGSPSAPQPQGAQPPSLSALPGRPRSSSAAPAASRIRTASNDEKLAKDSATVRDAGVREKDKTVVADASRDAKTAAKAVSQDDFFAATGGDAPKAAAAPAAKPAVVAKVDDSSKKTPASHAPQIAENKPSTPARPASTAPKAKPNQLTA